MRRRDKRPTSDDLFQLTGEMLDRGGLPAREAVAVVRRVAEDDRLIARYVDAIELHALLEGCHGESTVHRPQPPAATSGCSADPSATAGASSTASLSCADSACGAEIAELIGLFDEAAAAIDRADGLAATARRYPLRWIAGLAIAASLLLSWWTVPSEDNILKNDAPVGVLSNATGVRWSEGSTDRLLPARVVAGQEIALERGVAELTLTSGVVVVMRGPAHIAVVSPMRVRAKYGAVRARVGEAAKGFVLETPTTNVVDLGTEFGVDIDPKSGDTDVVVFDGKIDLAYVQPGRSRSSSNRRAKPLGLLEAGEGLRVASSGATARIVSIHSGTYPEIADGAWEAARTPLIVSVSDNLRSPDATQYYQIVHRNFHEDARSFVDRRHEWNGAQQNGLPPYLIGGDYVQTFNSDKLKPDLRISVELSAPAMLYVLFDRRVAPPAWLVSNFEATGDVVGVDEEYQGIQAVRVRDIGPGASIDTWHTVWRQRIDRPGTVELGGLPSEEIRTSMYGVVAQPLLTDAAASESNSGDSPRIGVVSAAATVRSSATSHNSSGDTP